MDRLTMSHKLMNWRTKGKHIDEATGWCAQKKKKHSRKSVEWHKKRILARLNPRVDKGQRIIIEQHISPQHMISTTTGFTEVNSKQSLVFLRVQSLVENENHTHFLRKHPVQEHHRIVRALRYLVDEGKIESNMTTKEWDVQLALGTAEIRKFYIIHKEK